MAKNFYETLGVSRDATPDEIKKAYRRLAKRYHPDVNKGDKQAEEKFKDISEAYEVVSDQEKRKQYDAFGGYGPPGGAGGAGFDPSQWGGKAYTWTSPGGSHPFDFDDLSEIFKQAGAGQGGGRGKGSPGARKSASYDDLSDIFGDIFNAPGA